MKVGDIFIALGFDVDSQKLKEFDNSLVNVKNNLFGAKEYAIAAAYGLSQFAQSSLNAAANLGSFVDQTGLSADELQKWQNVATQINRNLTSETVQGSIMALQRMITGVQKLGEAGIQPFAMMGIDLREGQDAFSVLEQLRQKSKELDPAVFTNLISKMGLTPEFISVLKVSDAEFQALASNLKLTADQRGNLDQLAGKLGKITLELKNLKDTTLADWAPQIMHLIDLLKELGNVLSNTVVEAFKELFKAMGDNKSTLGWIARIVAVIGAGLALWASPIIATVAAVTSLILAINELWKLLSGEDNAFSMIGDKIADFLKDNKLNGLFTPGSPNNILNKLQDLEKQSQNNNSLVTPPAGASSNVSNSTSNTVTQNINVNGARDPHDTANTIKNSFEKTFKQLNRGVVN